jgi:hypothetical protein
MQRMKVIVAMVVIALVANFAYADLMLNMVATSVSNDVGAVISNSGHTVTNLKVGDIVLMDLYAYGSLTGSQASLALGSASGWVRETPTANKSSGIGVHGDISITGLSGMTTAPFDNLGYGLPPTQTANTFGDVDWHSDYGFAIVENGQPDITPPLTTHLGKFNYVVTAAAAGTTSTTLAFVANQDPGYTSWYDDQFNILDPTVGVYSSTGTVTLSPVALVPEPSTLILLSMGALALLAIRRKK